MKLSQKFSKKLVLVLISIIISSLVWSYYYNKINEENKWQNGRIGELTAKNLDLNNQLEQSKKDLQTSNAVSQISTYLTSSVTDLLTREDKVYKETDRLLLDYDAFARDNCYFYGSITNQYNALQTRYSKINNEYSSISQDATNLVNKLNGGSASNSNISY